MPATVSLPVFVRVGDGNEHQIGQVEIGVSGGGVTRHDIAEFLRAAAEAYEHPEQEDSTDAPAHG